MSVLSSVLSLIIALLNSSAQAETPKLAAFAGHYLVKSCSYSENYKSLPKDYFCRGKELTLLDKKDGSFDLVFLDERNRQYVEVVMRAFRKAQKDGATDEGTFENADDSTAGWTESIHGGAEHLTDTRTFSANSDGSVRYYRDFHYYNNDVYKTANWDFVLVKK